MDAMAQSELPPLPRTIIITGGGRGIGRAVARDLTGSTDAGLV
jgi:NAD(P)-dependent dehydrogenase (short-subunit alcohol dehydrogenase family)